MKRRDFVGNVTSTTIANSISNTDTVIELIDPSTLPTGSDGEFVIVLDRTLINEEKVLISSRSGGNLTVSQRGYDGTDAAAHDSGATVDHVLDAETVKDMNRVTYDNLVLTWMGV